MSRTATLGPSTPVSHRSILAQHHQKYEHGVNSGEFIPFAYPMATYGAAILLSYFLISPRSRWCSPLGRYFTFGCVLAWHTFLIRNCRSHSMTVGFGIGIVSAWGVLWSAVVLIFCDAKAELRRVKRTEPPTSHSKGFADKQSRLHRAWLYEQSESYSLNETFSKDFKSQTPPRYHWQGYPIMPWRERLEWTLDLLTNFRGIGWNWTIAGVPSRPLEVENALHGSSNQPGVPRDLHVSRRGIERFDTYRSVVSHNAWLFAKGYLALDALKVLINRDPYFWGHIDCSPPQHLPIFVQDSLFLLRGYRLVVTMCMIWLGLRTIFCFGPLFFVGLVGPRYLGSNGEPWMYVDHYGDYSNVLDRGLAGWWGGWWHQTFRYAFQASGTWVIKCTGLDPKSSNARTVQLFVAFSLSGVLHACASITMLGGTAPWSNSFLFFFLQPLGILAEKTWRAWLQRVGLSRLIPKRLGQAASFVFVHLWLWLTAPLLADDFARGGVWLMEPVMFSPLRAMGLGVEGDGFFCWGGRLAEWHRSKRWSLLSGIEL